MTEGINHWVLHVYIHQPWEDRKPGVNAWFSTEFNRHNAWFEQSREWIDYYRRCQFLLQQGKPVADVAYFIGEDTPKMTGVRKPELPAGFNFDYVNAEVIQQRLSVKNGRFVLPDGMSYALLVLPELDTMRPELLRKIRNLVKAGGAIFGPPPKRSPSLERFPRCDEEIQHLAAEIWGDLQPTESMRRFGKGRVFQGQHLLPALTALGLSRDFSGADPKQVLWTHRSTGDAEIYFLSNQTEQELQVSPEFRVKGKAPEFWDAGNSKITRSALYATTGSGGVRVPLRLEPRGSLFVLFRRPIDDLPRVLRVDRDGRRLLDAAPVGTRSDTSETPPAAASGINNFTMAGWVNPAIDIGLPKEAASGVCLDVKRNEAVVPVHGGSAFPSDDHACAGVSVGRNGVAVYEHSGNYFAPLLVFPAELTNWTHVAVVYETGRPTLYLNGAFVRQGLRSRYQVHSSVSRDPSRGSGFRGQIMAFEEFGRAITPAEIAALATGRPAAGRDKPLPEIQVSLLDKATLEAEASEKASFQLIMADGRVRKLDFRPLPAPFCVPGPWRVEFSRETDAPAPITLDQLSSLTEIANPAVKFFAGTATYSTWFDVPPVMTLADQGASLDLGRVECLAEVVLNGVNLGVLWKPPFVVDVARAIRLGSNTLEVRVTGTWRNRLVGDAAHPDGLGGTATYKPWLAADLKFKPDDDLSPFGLLGPVRLLNTSKTRFSP